MSLSTQQLVRLIAEASPRGIEGTIYFPNNSCIAIWDRELTGQFSDGAWENSAPHNAWQFWSDMKTALGKPGLKANTYPMKTGYNLGGLIEYVGDRLLAYGKMGSVTDNPAYWEHADMMPENLEKFKATKANNKYISGIPDDVAEAFYASGYSMSDVKRDLATIKMAMKTDPFTFVPGAAPAAAAKGAGAAVAPTAGGAIKPGVTSRVENVNPETNTKKFWQVTVNNKSANVNWGRIGTAGQSQMKNFSSPQQANSWAQEMLSSKLAKGYQLVAAPKAASYGDSVKASLARSPTQAAPAPAGDQRRSEPRAAATKTGSYKAYPGGKGKPPVARVKGQLFRGPAGSKATPGSSYKMQPSDKGLKVSGDDWTQDWMPTQEGRRIGPYETHVRAALSGRRRGLSEDLKPTFHNLMTGARQLDEEVRKQRTDEGWAKSRKVNALYEALKPYYEAILGRPMRFKHRDIETVLRAAIRKALREAVSV
jgi:predicted DNA-binding WGR domain protein